MEGVGSLEGTSTWSVMWRMNKVSCTHLRVGEGIGVWHLIDFHPTAGNNIANRCSASPNRTNKQINTIDLEYSVFPK